MTPGMTPVMTLTLDGLIRALRLTAHRLAEDVDRADDEMPPRPQSKPKEARDDARRR